MLRRIEALQPTVNAFITVTADEARDAARRAEAAVMAGERLGPAPRRAVLGQGPAVHEGRPHHDGLADLRRPGARRGRGARSPAARGRRHPDRQDDHPRVRPQAADRQPALRRHPQPVGSLAHRGRLVRRRRRGGRHRPGAAGARHRRRRLRPPARLVLRHRRAQADARARPARAAGRPLLLDVLHRPDGAERGGDGRLLRRDRRASTPATPTRARSRRTIRATSRCAACGSAGSPGSATGSSIRRCSPRARRRCATWKARAPTSRPWRRTSRPSSGPS